MFSCPLLTAQEEKKYEESNLVKINSYGSVVRIVGDLIDKTNAGEYKYPMKKGRQIKNPGSRILVGEMSTFDNVHSRLAYITWMDKTRHRNRVHALSVPLSIVNEPYPDDTEARKMIYYTE